MIAHLFKTKRGRQIIFALVKYNFFLVVPQPSSGLVRRWRNWRLKKMSIAQRVRLVFEELGPVFVKFGQVLSVRPDLIPAEFVDELSKLQDGVPFEKDFDVHAMIQEELGVSVSEVFAEFDETPIAAASLSQVYKARLFSGEQVAVKVQRPGIPDQIESDIVFLRAISEILSQKLDSGWIYDPRRMVDDFSKAIHLELDFENEARNFERFAENFADQDDVKVPKVYWKYTTSRLLTMEFMKGRKISEIALPEYCQQYDIERVAVREAEVILQQIFEHGFFHADPHPANIFVQPPATIVLLDVGMVGYLDKNTSFYGMQLLSSVVERDPKKVIRSWEGLGIIKQGKRLDYQNIEQDLNELFYRYIDIASTGKHRRISLFGLEMMELMVNNHLSVPPNLSLTLKAFSTVELTGKGLDPSFDIFQVAKPYVEKLMRDKFSMSKTFERVKSVFYESLDFMEELPRDLQEIIRKVRAGNLRVRIKHEGLEDLIDEMRASNSRMSLTFLIAAIAISASLASQREIEWISFSPTVLGILGYSIAIILSITVIGSFFISNGRKK